MAYTFSVGNTPATGPVAIYLLKTTLVTAGWSVVADSDGSTYNATGGQVTTGAAGAGGLGNSNAWIRLQAPAVGGNTREIVFQRANSGVAATDDRAWRIKYSANAGFTGGSPGISQTPSAIDEVIMIGAGTDASPTFLASWFNANAAYRWHIAAGGAAELYSFVAWSNVNTFVTAATAMCLDVMVSGSYDVSDVDPAVMYCSSAANNQLGITELASANDFATTNVTNPALARAWLGATSNAGILTVGTNSQNVRFCGLGNNMGANLSVAVNPFSSKDTLFVPWWGRQGTAIAPNGFKGQSTLFAFGSMLRANMDTCDVSATKDKAFFGYLWLPWDGSTPTL